MDSLSLHNFSFLGPLLKTTVNKSITSSIDQTMRPKSDKSSEIVKTIFGSTYSYLPITGDLYAAKNQVLDLTGLPLTGFLPHSLHLVIKIGAAMGTVFEEASDRVEELSPAERRAIHRQIPFGGRLIKSGRGIRQSPVFQVVHKTAVVSKMALTGFTDVGTGIVSGAGYLAKEGIKKITPTKIQDGFQKVVMGTINNIELGSSRKVYQGVYRSTQAALGSGLVGHTVNFLTRNLRFIDDTLKKIDQTMRSVTPLKLIGSTFSTLFAFSELDNAVQENLPPNIKTPMDREKFKLYYAANNNYLPTGDLNRAFSYLYDPSGYDGTVKKRFLKAIADEANKQTGDKGGVYKKRWDKVEKGFTKFIADNNWKDVPEKDLDVIKAAFFLTHLYANDSSVDPLALLFAKAVLLKPTDFLGIEEIQIDRLTNTMGVLYAKEHLYPTIVDKFLPSDFKDLISGLSKVAKIDINDILSTAITKAIMENGVDFLTNPTNFSTIILGALGEDLTRYADYSIGDGSQKTIRDKWQHLLQSIHSSDLPGALEQMAVRKNPKNRDQIGKEVHQQLNATVNDKMDNLSYFVRQFVIGKAGRSLSSEIEALSARKDWGIFMMMFASDLNRTLKNPEAAPDFNLLDPTTLPKIVAIVRNIYPAASSRISVLMKLPKVLLQSTLRQSQEALANIKYTNYVSGIENTLLMNQITGRLNARLLNSRTHWTSHELASEHQMMIQYGVNQALKTHLENVIKAVWGVTPSDTGYTQHVKEYLVFLNKIDDEHLLKRIKQVTLDPTALRAKFTEEKERALAVATLELDELLQDPIPLPPLETLDRHYVEERARETDALSSKLSELEQALILADGGEAQVTDFYYSYTPLQIQEMIDETKIRLNEARESEVQWKRAEKLLNLQDQVKELRNSLTHLSLTNVTHISDEQVIVQKEKEIDQLHTEIRILQEKAKSREKQKLPPKESDVAKLEELQLRVEVQNDFVKIQREQVEIKAKQLAAIVSTYRLEEYQNKLLALKTRLYDSMSERDDLVVSSIKHQIKVLESNIEKAMKEIAHAETAIYGNKILQTLKSRLDYVDNLFLEAHFRSNPEKYEQELSKTRLSMEESYKAYLNTEFAGLLETMPLKDLTGELRTIKNTAEQLLSSRVSLDMAKILNKQNKLSSLFSEELDQSEKRKNVDQRRTITEKLKSQVEGIEKRIQQDEEIIEVCNQIDTVKDLLTEKNQEIHSYIQGKEKSMNILHWAAMKAKNVLFEKDEHLLSLKKDASKLLHMKKELIKQLSLMQSGISDNPQKEVDRLLEETGLQSLAEVRTMIVERASAEEEEAEKIEKDLAVILHARTELEKEQVTQTETFSKENAFLEKEISLLARQLNSLKHLQSLAVAKNVKRDKGRMSRTSSSSPFLTSPTAVTPPSSPSTSQSSLSPSPSDSPTRKLSRSEALREGLSTLRVRGKEWFNWRGTSSPSSSSGGSSSPPSGRSSPSSDSGKGSPLPDSGKGSPLPESDSDKE